MQLAGVLFSWELHTPFCSLSGISDFNPAAAVTVPCFCLFGGQVGSLGLERIGPIGWVSKYFI